mmetsp:Transcript_91206/g.262613  ORF Transcript_91206/g.262613 Transcript_91206/m.262613 type:complete len:110 (-) Transcript_91206:74-403(-)
MVILIRIRMTGVGLKVILSRIRMTCVAVDGLKGPQREIVVIIVNRFVVIVRVMIIIDVISIIMVFMPISVCKGETARHVLLTAKLGYAVHNVRWHGELSEMWASENATR